MVEDRVREASDGSPGSRVDLETVSLAGMTKRVATSSDPDQDGEGTTIWQKTSSVHPLDVELHLSTLRLFLGGQSISTSNNFKHF